MGLYCEGRQDIPFQRLPPQFPAAPPPGGAVNTVLPGWRQIRPASSCSAGGLIRGIEEPGSVFREERQYQLERSFKNTAVLRNKRPRKMREGRLFTECLRRWVMIICDMSAGLRCSAWRP